MIIETTTYARAGLIGNPSDGYFGKTIAFSVRNFAARAILYESPQLEIKLHRNDRMSFDSISDLVADITTAGYYGGIRLIKASIKRFQAHCQENGYTLPVKNFTIAYDSNIPVRVGLAGSSAIITAVIRALMQFYNIAISPPVLANLVLSVEAQELGIPAGLQDRVIQAFGGLMYMDFNREQMEDYGYGHYEPIELSPEQLPNFYIAYSNQLSEGTEVLHSNIRQRYEAGDTTVHSAMQEFAAITETFRSALLGGDTAILHKLINHNFNLRASICQISRRNWELINCARNLGASAKFCGSGGAIVGIYRDQKMYEQLEHELKRIGAEIIKPCIFEECPDD